MTWWSEYNAVPRFVLAKLAIRCRFVDRFVGFRVPSRVSGQRFSTHGALPSLDRVPASPVPRLHRYYEGATTSRSREPGPLWFRLQAPRAPPVFVFAESAPNERGGKLVRPGTFGQPAFPARHAAPVGACGISQVSWRPILRLCPAPRPRPSRQDLAFSGLADTAPGLPKPKASAGT